MHHSLSLELRLQWPINKRDSWSTEKSTLEAPTLSLGKATDSPTPHLDGVGGAGDNFGPCAGLGKVVIVKALEKKMKFVCSNNYSTDMSEKRKGEAEFDHLMPESPQKGPLAFLNASK